MCAVTPRLIGEAQKRYIGKKYTEGDTLSEAKLPITNGGISKLEKLRFSPLRGSNDSQIAS